LFEYIFIKLNLHVTVEFVLFSVYLRILVPNINSEHVQYNNLELNY